MAPPTLAAIQMTAGAELEPRCQILVEYAKWTALSAVRSGSPIKAREPVYRLLDGVTFPKVLMPSLGPISCERFNEWHRCQTEDLCARAKADLPPKWVEAHGLAFPVGWGAKLINVFLKTTAYVGELGREGLRDVLHPPLDAGLQRGLRQRFTERADIVQNVTFGAIKDITDYETYRTVISGCRAAAKELGCSLFEVEQLWRP